MATCPLCHAPAHTHRRRGCSLPGAVSVGKGHECPTCGSSELLPRVLWGWWGWATHPQAATAGLAGGKRLSSAPSRSAWPCRRLGAVWCLHEHPDGAGSARVRMGPTVTGAGRAAWGGGCWQRRVAAPGLSRCRDPWPRAGCSPHCVPSEHPGPGGVRPWGQGGARGTPTTSTPHPPLQRHACGVCSRSSHPAMAQPVPLLVQCPLANRRGTESP